jgi:uncharacterized cupin superfamily protein
VTLVHWDEVESSETAAALAPLGGRWQALGDAAGVVGVGLQRIRATAGQLLTPPHRHTGTEEIVHVLSGNATLWQDGRTCTVGAGDTIVFLVRGPTHALIADGDFDMLVFGERHRIETGVLPRSGRAFVGGNAFAIDDDHPWTVEAPLGLPEGEPGERPGNVRAVDDAPSHYGGVERNLARGIAKRTGLNLFTLPPGTEGAPPHCHSADEELFVVLDGGGTLELWGRPDPAEPRRTAPAEMQPIRAGHVVSRPPGTGVSHCLRAGPDGLTYLAYGTREPNDLVWYPRSNKVFFRGLGVIGRLELLDYSDGEPE